MGQISRGPNGHHRNASSIADIHNIGQHQSANITSGHFGLGFRQPFPAKTFHINAALV